MDVVPELAEEEAEVEAAEDDVSEPVGKTTPVEEEVAVLGSSVKRTLVGEVDASVLAADEAAAGVLEPAEGLADVPTPADGVANAELGLGVGDAVVAEDPVDPAALPVGLLAARAPKDPAGGV